MAIPISFRSNSYSKYPNQNISLKAVLNRIVKLCNSKQNLEFRNCVKDQKQFRKDFINKLNDYYNTQQQQLYERMKQKCINKNDEELIECLLEQTINQNEINNKMQEFKDWRRNIIKTLI
ncbi:unnamed protein product (macronuclear) [Paramecium tetraurelia]|uniref:Uncharacterized protein n=1 Tax=Paramecium tetraurelia TaxID=5888 RepID=A0DM86_PARTE|nr:uncharacterized protein GSPATT00018371001 [Paramecium tetraurelia]CAK84153.1 unnamed protein product [Paramecium tetraurelia]|eukprot:XP_001451550.1 hypothetical protein (macronuclear) [Paramecium tetraurelia strain d4-2]